MKVFHSAFQLGHWAPGSVAAIGKFDGLHIGHQRVIRLAIQKAKTLGVKCFVVTFHPSPEGFFHPEAYKPLTEPEEMLSLLGQLGVDAVLFMPFNRRLACQAPDAFAKDVLVDALQVREIFVGADFCFGKDRAGRVADLEDFGHEWGFTVNAVPLLYANGAKISSSLIRRLIGEGRLKDAERYLGRKLPA